MTEQQTQTESGQLLDHRLLGLTDDELDLIVADLGRLPTATELAIYAVMWSEHCSYKSSRAYLGRLPSEGRAVLVGPGENAGVVDVGDGLAVALRIESHNHPSFIEPYQGAATGVGGILRDIFTVGARPIALMDALFFGPLGDSKSHYVADGVVRGIAGYGNAVGVPTVGGQTSFDPSFARNPLVNVFCLGVLPQGRLVLARARQPGDLAVLLGSRTGRDGIGGVSVLASAGFADDEQAGGGKRPSVQIADPFEEKRLIEACLELLDAGLVVGIQDLGGAGLSCAASEIAAHAGLGMDVDADAVPRREPGMNGAEVMTSESQERMLAIVSENNLAAVNEVCRRWEIEAAVVGVVTDPGPSGVGHLRVLTGPENEVIADIPARSLADGAPRYERPAAPTEREASPDPDRPRRDGEPGEELLALLTDPAALYSQYDHRLFLNTVIGPGEGDATLLKLAAPGVPWKGKGLAMSVDANPAWCALDPRAGAAATVIESALNVACAGGRPIALVDCLNFGNPEHPGVMWQLRQSIEGIAEACSVFGLPVVGGNVSLYNESAGRDIDPTPVVAVVGLLDRLARKPPARRWEEGDALVLLGPDPGSLAGSRWARSVGRRGGTFLAGDLAGEWRLVAFVARLVAEEAGAVDAPRLIGALHDVSDGGLGLALAECAIASRVGAEVGDPGGRRGLFAEVPGRVLVATGRPEELAAAAGAAGVPAAVIGRTGGGRLRIGGLADLGLADLFAARDRWGRSFTEPTPH